MLADSVDVLLDRLAAKVTGRPQPGSPLWSAQWAQRDTETELGRHRRHLLARIAVAALAGCDTTADVRAARNAGVGEEEITAATGLARRRSPRGRKVPEGQLPIW
jgi:alkylhydroperoxidase/carboxymuconolactone decarboxylase family protein YurZ